MYNVLVSCRSISVYVNILYLSRNFYIEKYFLNMCVFASINIYIYIFSLFIFIYIYIYWLGSIYLYIYIFIIFSLLICLYIYIYKYESIFIYTHMIHSGMIAAGLAVSKAVLRTPVEWGILGLHFPKRSDKSMPQRLVKALEQQNIGFEL